VAPLPLHNVRQLRELLHAYKVRCWCSWTPVLKMPTGRTVQAGGGTPVDCALANSISPMAAFRAKSTTGSFGMCCKPKKQGAHSTPKGSSLICATCLPGFPRSPAVGHAGCVEGQAPVLQQHRARG
jgi:hypothetical protein